ncbi:hypothetical protein FJT64_026572 [Amphibalanus amphitrite]|uniref:Uncharacterized protein n=1 Tax=Amphibalanus amphitrite TaxID=1232801 RepID=A0A6A4WGG1_AMPAM|nr:hypothetical protein FJT64_026572 [Amphibalanus amphitrite]
MEAPIRSASSGSSTPKQLATPSDRKLSQKQATTTSHGRQRPPAQLSQQGAQLLQLPQHLAQLLHSGLHCPQPISQQQKPAVRFFRPLTGREKQRRISVWVQNVEHQRLAAPDSTEAVTCDTPSTETTGRLSASLVSQHGSSAATPTQHQHQQHQHQRTAPAHRHQHHHGPGPAKRPHV